MKQEKIEFEVIFKVMSDIRIGYRKIGNLHTTRYYIPGWVLWASCVNKLVNAFGKSGYPDKINPYQFWGEFLKKQIKFSYLFLHYDSFHEKNGRLIPEGGTKNYIEQKYISSTTGTALSPESQVADEGTLHESEWILAKQKDTGESSKLKGSVIISREGLENGHIGIDIKNSDVMIKFKQLGKEKYLFKDLISNLKVGGDITAGKGKIKLIKYSRIKKDACIAKCTTGHVIWSDKIEARGKIEAVTRRSWDITNQHPGGISDYFLAWVPGSIVEADDLEMDCWGRFFAKT